MSNTPKSYGKLVIVRDLTKKEARDLENRLSTRSTLRVDGWIIRVDDVSIGVNGHNIQYLTVKGTKV